MAISADILQGIESLDPLPITAQRLMSVLGDENVPFQDIVRIIEADAAVTSNLLRLANSPVFGGRFKIERLSDAVIRLGPTTLLDIALGDYLRSMTRKAPIYDLSEDDLWLHSAVASLAVKEVAREATKADIPALAGIAALVHDIGKLIISRYNKADAKMILEHCEAKGLSFTEAERALFGYDHAEIGAAMARHWKFPEEITQAIERHHEFPVAEGTPCLDAVITANFVTKTIGIGLGAEGLNLKIDQACLHRLGLDFERFCRVCARTAAKVGELKKAFGFGH